MKGDRPVDAAFSAGPESSAHITCIHVATLVMFTVIETDNFAGWMTALKDRLTRARLQARVRKASLGNLGDVKPVGDGVFEMREFFGPGWRMCMYYVMRHGVVIVMLGGGDKSSQERDIEQARKLALELRNEQDQDPSV